MKKKHVCFDNEKLLGKQELAYSQSNKIVRCMNIYYLFV